MDVDREVEDVDNPGLEPGRAPARQRQREQQRQARDTPFRSPFGKALEDVDDHNLGPLEANCPHCHALKFKEEDPSMCCMNGKVVLPPLQQPPEPLWSLLSNRDPSSRQFRQRIRQYNSAFNMASSSAKVERWFPDGVQAFRINGVVHQPASAFDAEVVM